jgi:hypothetical protein
MKPKRLYEPLEHNINEYSVIMECTCGYSTDVYSQADLDMWNDEGLIYPDCPKPTCKRTLKKARIQYVEL